MAIDARSNVMDIAGIIVEFNPFHNGHDFHIKKTREITGCKYIIAVMSGNFVQRGEPAICDKWRRTEMALNLGVDMVIEIPVPYVIAGADYFARASVGLLAKTGIVDCLSFGSELGDLSILMEAGQILAEEPSLYKQRLQAELSDGKSFATAHKTALRDVLLNKNSNIKNIPESLFTKPNNCLAMEYCKVMQLLNNPFQIFTTHRAEGGVSATKIRKDFINKTLIQNQMPDIAYKILKDAPINELDNYSSIFRYLCITKELDLGEGLEHRFKRLAPEYNKLSDLIMAVKTKRYTHTRLQRAVISVLLEIDKSTINMYEESGGVQYIRVLGFREESRHLLSELSRKATLPVITHKKIIGEVLKRGGVAKHMLKKELLSEEIYNLVTTP